DRPRDGRHAAAPGLAIHRYADALRSAGRVGDARHVSSTGPWVTGGSELEQAGAGPINIGSSDAVRHHEKGLARGARAAPRLSANAGMLSIWHRCEPGLPR